MKQFETIIQGLFTIVPLLKRDLLRPDFDNAENNLSPSHFHILFMLDDLGVQSMTEIGRHMQINKSNLTPLVQKLIDKQLVERIHDDKDRRYIRIGLTKLGVNLLDDQKSKMAEHLTNKLAVLTPEELDRLAGSLNDVKIILSKLYE